MAFPRLFGVIATEPVSILNVVTGTDSTKGVRSEALIKLGRATKFIVFDCEIPPMQRARKIRTSLAVNSSFIRHLLGPSILLLAGALPIEAAADGTWWKANIGNYGPGPMGAWSTRAEACSACAPPCGWTGNVSPYSGIMLSCELLCTNLLHDVWIGNCLVWPFSCPSDQVWAQQANACVPYRDINQTSKPPQGCPVETRFGKPIYPLTGSERHPIATGMQAGAEPLTFTYDSSRHAPTAMATDMPRMPVDPPALGRVPPANLHEMTM